MANRSRGGRGLWIGLGLGLAAGLIGTRMNDDEPTIVSVAVVKNEGSTTRFYRAWSNGVIEDGVMTAGGPSIQLERWTVLSGPAEYPVP